MNILPPDEVLLEYLEGLLPESEQQVIRLALARDPDLRRRLIQLEKSMTSLRHVRRHEIRARLREIDRSRHTGLRWLPWLLAFGACILAWRLLQTGGTIVLAWHPAC